MAGASSSSEAGSRKYDVFINFRGEDTRRCFVCHLYEALKLKALETYIDSEELRKGEDLSELLEAIKGSRLSIVVFSKEYASSTWCLRELVQILECKDLQGQIVVPVFYEVDPSQVRKLEEGFGAAFAKHERDPKVDNEEVKGWKSALTRATTLSGHHSTNYQDDNKLIKSIVEDIFKKLIPASISKNGGLIGMDFHMEEIDSLLEVGVNDCRIVGIWGMGGIGKSTIAEAVYEKFSPQFEHKCFLANVKEDFTKSGKEQMFKNLVCAILKIKDQHTLDGCRNEMRKRLGEKKILLVLDDVDNKDQIDTLIGENPSFGGGSRVIITTRDKRLLPDQDLIYEPKLFTTEKSLELLCRHAFRTMKYSESYDAILRSAVEYTQGLPLALRVLGGLLDNKTVRQWEYELEKIKKIPMTNVGRVLRASYDGLDDCQKNIFLDIACFFRGEHKDFVTKFHERCGYFPQTGLTVLEERSLLTFSEYRLEMHDLIQDMGRDIVRQESTEDPGRRSRLWYREDVVEVLTRNKGRKTVQGISLDLSELNEVCVNKAALAGMKNLRMLRLSQIAEWKGLGRTYTDTDCTQCVTGSGDLKFPRELRVLVWQGYPLESLPSDMSTKNLIMIIMYRSNLKQLWKETKSLVNLVHMDLRYSKDLIRTPDFSDAKKLEWLELEGCSSLLEVDPSISAFERIPYLNLKGCSNIRKFPNISGNMKELRYLSLDESAITEVPSLVNDLPGLETLSLRDCKELRSLPSSIHMESLGYLNLSGCSKLAEFPEISEVMVRLTELCLDDTAIEKLPSSIINFTSLEMLSVRGCRSLVCLPEEICNLVYLENLYLTDCSNVEQLPENFANLKYLDEPITAAGSGIKQLPFCIVRMERSVSFKGCKEITAPFSSWPTWNHQNSSGSVLLNLDLSDCNLLELSDGIAHLSSLQDLNLSGNKNLESLPAAMNRLVHLYRLQVEGCTRLKSIPELSSSVEEIYANDCTSLETVSAPLNRGRYLTFANCLRLQQVTTNQIIDAVETSINQFNASDNGDFCKMFLPGSDIPDWFNHQSRGSSVTVQVAPDWFTDEFQGLAICAISNLQCAQTISAELSATFKAIDGHQETCWLTTMSVHGTHMPPELDHMFLAYLSSSCLEMWDWNNAAGKKYTEATFKIIARSDREDCSWITSCGVNLFMGNRETFGQ